MSELFEKVSATKERDKLESRSPKPSQASDLFDLILYVLGWATSLYDLGGCWFFFLIDSLRPINNFSVMLGWVFLG